MDPITIGAILAGSGVLGGISGYLGASSEADKQREYLSQLGELEKRVGATEAQRLMETRTEYDPLTAGYGDRFNKYLSALEGTDYTQFDVAMPDEFQYDVTAETQNLLNPELQAIIDRQTQSIEGSAAGSHKLFSGATGKAIARSTADITANEYARAQNAALNQQQNKYQQYIDRFRNSLAVNEVNRGNIGTNISNLGTAAATQGQQFTNQQQLLQGIRNAADTSRMGIYGQTAEAKAAQAGNNVLGGTVQGVLGGITGGIPVLGAMDTTK